LEIFRLYVLGNQLTVLRRKNMGISSGGIVSGIDTATIIDSLVEIEQAKVTKVEDSVEADNLKIDAFSTLKSKLTTVQTAIEDLSETSSFDLFETTTSDEDVVTVTGGEGSVDGQYDIGVYQLATNEKMISSDNKITSQTASLSSMGITVGTISVDGVDIIIDDDDTIQDLRSKINSATDSDGEKLGVTASVLNVSDTNFRLILSAKETGSEGIAYSGSTLQDLGIITDADGSKGNVNQVVQSTDDFSTAFSNLSTNESIQYSGTDHSGNTVTSTFVKTSTNTIDDFLKQVEESYHGTVDATIDSTTGKLVIENKISGSSELSMNSLTINNTAHTVNVATVGAEGAGVLSTGKDSYFSIENILMSDSSNSVEGTITGVTFELKSLSTDPVTVTLERDCEAVKEKIQTFIDAYNELLSYSKSVTSYADPDDEESTDGDLAGDSTVKSIVSQLSSQIKSAYNPSGSSGNYTTLTMFGLETDSSTGEFTLDSDTFEEGFDTNYDDLLNIFTTSGISANTSIALGRNTSDTKSGTYELEEIDSTHVRIKLAGSSEWYTSDERFGDVITFSDGPAKGLSITASEGTIGSSSTFTFSKGLGELLSDSIDNINDSNDGTIALRQSSLNNGIDRKEDRIDKLNAQVEAYRTRLTKQYSDMEQAMSTLQSQTQSIVDSLSSD
jgi:flagellar hook-associated protein 2